MFTQHSFGFSLRNIVYFIIYTIALVPSLTDARPRSSRKVRRQDSAPDKPCDGFFNTDYELFLAVDVYNCLITVPFNQTIALQFLQYYEETIQLQSTLAYLKNPPEGYQQPKFDLLGAIELLKSEVNTGKFKNEYDFEVALQKSVFAAHDAHVTLAYGILSIWVFGSPYGIGSASKNGIELPKVFVIDDLIESSAPGSSYQASAIATINDEGTTGFLETFAAEQVGNFLEPHADWNALVTNAAGDIQSLYSVWEGGALFYPGENITFKFENGTSTDGDDGSKLSWLAQYSPYVDSSTTPNITTGQQLFDWFILGIDTTPGADTVNQDDTQASDDTNSTATATDSSTTATGSSSAIPTETGDPTDNPTPDDSEDTSSEANTLAWDNQAYPSDTIVSQPNLGGSEGGYVTGYILNDNVTGILSIPSFVISPESANTFSTAVRDFLNFTKAAGVTRVIIDVQRNLGGSDLLATDTFKQFFPQLEPVQGARGRAEAIGDGIGNTFSNFYQSKQPSEFTDPSYEAFSASVWTAPAAINVETNANFTNWQEYFGPLPYNGDEFTRVRKDNLSSAVFTEQTAGIVVYGFANETVNTTQPYPAKDVIILTDGVCSSACARFVELMKHVGGARTVVAGGRPETGPQQAVAGNKGALTYSSFDLDSDIDTATTLNSSLTNILPQERDDLDFILTYASINLLDNIRRGTEIPLQFEYEAADCRIFYTTWTIYNYENLWNYVIDAFYRNPSLCVAGSTNVHEAPKPTPSTVGGLIMAGLSPENPPSRDQPSKRKRSLRPLSDPLPLAPRAELPTPTTPDLDLQPRSDTAPFEILPAELTSSRDDAPFDIDPNTAGCRSGFVRFSAPKCLAGKLSVAPDCAPSCNLAGNIPCHGVASICKQPPGRKGFCITQAQNLAERDCKASGTGGGGPQSTRAANPAVKGLSFGRGARLGGGSRRG